MVFLIPMDTGFILTADTTDQPRYEMQYCGTAPGIGLTVTSDPWYPASRQGEPKPTISDIIAAQVAVRIQHWLFMRHGVVHLPYVRLRDYRSESTRTTYYVRCNFDKSGHLPIRVRKRHFNR